VVEVGVGQNGGRSAKEGACLSSAFFFPSFFLCFCPSTASSPVLLAVIHSFDEAFRRKDRPTDRPTDGRKKKVRGRTALSLVLDEAVEEEVGEGLVVGGSQEEGGMGFLA